MKICAVVVTFNRKRLLTECLTALQNQTRKLDAIFVIDNASSDGTDNIVKKYFNDIQYIKLSENIGGAGGFYEGLKLAYSAGFDWIWGMDDDAIADCNACLRLVEGIHRNSPIKAFWSNCDRDKSFSLNSKIVTNWMFVGFCVNKEIIKIAGLPRKDFFIYHDDFEYAYRLNKYGYKILKLRDSIIQHNDFKKRGEFKKIILGRKLRFPVLDDWRLYYLVRNDLLKYEYKDINKYKEIKSMLKHFFTLLLVNKIQARIFLKGFHDGLLGKTGKIIAPKAYKK